MCRDAHGGGPVVLPLDSDPQGHDARQALFQIRIADRHGLRPSGEPQCLRSVALLPLWGFAMFSVTRILGLEYIGMLLCAAAFFATLVDAAPPCSAATAAACMTGCSTPAWYWMPAYPRRNCSG